jgi:hypothetical protein
MAVQDFDYVPVLVNGMSKFLQVAFNAGCALASGNLPSGFVLLDVVPDAPAGYQLKTRVCGDPNETVAVYDPAHPHGNGTGNPLPTDGSAWPNGDPNDHDDLGNKVTHSNPVILIDQTQS